MSTMRVVVDDKGASLEVDGVLVNNALVVAVDYPDAYPKEARIVCRLIRPGELIQKKRMAEAQASRHTNDLIGQVAGCQELVDSKFDITKYKKPETE